MEGQRLKQELTEFEKRKEKGNAALPFTLIQNIFGPAAGVEVRSCLCPVLNSPLKLLIANSETQLLAIRQRAPVMCFPLLVQPHLNVTAHHA